MLTRRNLNQAHSTNLGFSVAASITVHPESSPAAHALPSGEASTLVPYVQAGCGGSKYSAEEASVGNGESEELDILCLRDRREYIVLQRRAGSCYKYLSQADAKRESTTR